MLAATFSRGRRGSDDVVVRRDEEFVVVADAVDAAGLIRLAERLRMLIGQSRVATPTVAVGVKVSIGVAMATSGDTAAMVLDRADQRLLEAKRTGRDRVVGPDSP